MQNGSSSAGSGNFNAVKSEPQSAGGHPGQEATDGVTPVSLSDSDSEDESSDKTVYKVEEPSGTPNTFVFCRPGREPIVLPRPPFEAPRMEWLGAKGEDDDEWPPRAESEEQDGQQRGEE